MPVRPTAAVLALGLPLLFAACGQSETVPGAEVDPYAGGASYPWVYAAPEGKVAPLSLTPGENTLYYEPVLSARNGWGPIEVNRSNGEQAAGDGKPISIGGKTYARGFGVHAASEMTFSLKGTGVTCDRFTVDVGVDDEVGPRGKVVFQVYLDGALAYSSGAMKGKDAARHVDLNIGGKEQLRLVVTDAGNGIDYDHADWADPKISCQAVNTSPASLTLDQSKLEIFHKHTGTLKATFAGVAGTVDLRLEVEAGKQTGLELQTRRVELPGSGEATTRDVVIAAPTFPYFPSQDDPNPLLANYRLIASQNGRDVASTAVTIDEKPLKVTTAFEPAEVSSPGGAGDTRRVTVVLSVSPPLSAPEPLELRPYTTTEAEYLQATPVGPVYGTGGTMRRDYDITLKKDTPAGVQLNLSYYVEADGFAGYRLPYYWTSFTYLKWTTVP